MSEKKSNDLEESRLLSIVVPIYNDAVLAQNFVLEARRVFTERFLADLDLDSLEILFVDDGSDVMSAAHLDELCNSFEEVNVVHLSRNFGQHAAIKCGFDLSEGDYVIRSNVDMQDPLESSTEMLKLLVESQSDRVVGYYERRETSLSNRLTSQIFYRLFNRMSGYRVPQNTSALRVVNRRFVDSMRDRVESQVFPQDLEEWVGFKTQYMPIKHRPRQIGSSSYTFRRRMNLALTAISMNAGRFFKFAWLGGVALSLLATLYLSFLTVGYLTGRAVLKGFMPIIALQVLSIGVLVVLLGLLGMMVDRNLSESRGRPPYIVSRITSGRERLGE